MATLRSTTAAYGGSCLGIWGPGDVHMAEDLTGHGHTTRVVGQVPRVTATIHVEG